MSVMDFIHKHWLIFKVIVIWLMSLVSFIVIVGMLYPPDMNSATASVIVSALGIPAIIAGLYKFKKSGDK